MINAWTQTTETDVTLTHSNVNNVVSFDVVASEGITLEQMNGAKVIVIRSSTLGDCNITANPQIAFAGSNANGLVIEVWGASDTRTVTFDNGNGLVLVDGSVTLGENDSILFRFFYDENDGLHEWRQINYQSNQTAGDIGLGVGDIVTFGGITDTPIVDTIDNTKALEFDVSGITTGTTRTIIMPDTDVDLGAIPDVSTFIDSTEAKLISEIYT